MYHIVKFQKTNEVGIVPHTWLHGREYCFWPKFKNSNQLDKGVKTCCLPDKDTWKLYTITVMYSSESYDKVRRKLPLATDMSNLDTEAEDDRESRKRRPTGRYLSSSSSSSDEETQVAKSKESRVSKSSVPMPPSPPRLRVSPQPPSPPRLPVSLPVAMSPPLPTLSVPTSPRRSPRRRILPEPSPLLSRQDVWRPSHSPSSTVGGN
ncbi:amyloid beta A4 precursor protein-binding family B member 1-interacting protein-like isoform X2 [Haliotis rubra]|uniref:amyloid beta A4 precursor protein-binding family B member 1-interacting protein-like isoform X2 n=1 Tax=Haliotis rubra TaxID=36100 RepID=UPI001EE5E395|nr:amyloid beta A4 precursor protein-binding family B member 1-interacting protein-like isoform X2 [Haliotis rubra]